MFLTQSYACFLLELYSSISARKRESQANHDLPLKKFNECRTIKSFVFSFGSAMRINEREVSTDGSRCPFVDRLELKRIMRKYALKLRGNS